MWTLVQGEQPKVGDEVEFDYHDCMSGTVSSTGTVVMFTNDSRPWILVADDHGSVVRLALSVRLRA